MKLEEIQIISQDMLSFAKVGNWEKLPDLEKKRKKIMEVFFSQPVDQGYSQIEKIIQDVLSINDEIEKLAEKEKKSITLQQQSVKKRQNVHSAYLQNK